MFILVVFAGLALIIGHAVWFSRRMSRALADVAGVDARALRWGRIGYLAVTATMPLAVAAYVAYMGIARPEVSRGPSGWLYDYAIVYPFWFTTIWSVQCSLVLLPFDVVHVALRAARRAPGPRWIRRKQILVLGVAAAALVYVPVRLALDARSLETRHYRHESADLPAALEGYRIALIADLQADAYTDPDRMAELADAVNAAEPHLVLIAGDMITRGPDYIDASAAAVARLRARDGVYACVGDHENWVYFRDDERSVRAVTAALARADVVMSDNAVHRVDVGGAVIAVALATNNYVSRIDPEDARALIASTLPADLRVLVTHQATRPLVAAARDGGIDLVLSGHTHGGQLRFWTPLGDLTLIRVETPYVSGGYRAGDTRVIVTNGLGVSIVPWRYRAAASIEIIELRRGPPKSGDPTASQGRP